jgi:hypothetical protein
MRTTKPDRRGKAPVDTGDIDMETPTPAQQSAKAGAGTGGGRERARRVSERMPKAAGVKAHVKSHDGAMMDKGIDKKRTADQRESLAKTKPDGAAPAEAAPTQKQTLSDKPAAKRTLRNTGVDAAQ